MNCQILTQTKADLISLEITDQTKIICLTETGANADNMKYYYLEGFLNWANYTRSVHKGGGVGIWCHESINAEPLNIPVTCIEFDFEMCGILLKSDNYKNGTIILTCYRSPGSNFNVFCDKLIQVFEYIFKPSVQIILIGDFNKDPVRDAKDYNILSQILASYNVLQINDTPTRGNYILDHIYTNTLGASCSVKGVTFSDHDAVTMHVSQNCLEENSGQSVVKRIFSEDNIKSFYSNLENEDWMSVLRVGCVDQAFSRFHDLFSYYFNLSFPLKIIKSKTKQRNKWITSEVVKSSMELKDLYKLKAKYPELENFYKMKKKHHSNLVHTTKKVFYQNRIQNADNTTREAWRIVSDLTNKKKCTKNIEIDIDGCLRTNTQEIANLFNNFFQQAPINILKNINRDQNYQPNIDKNSSSLFLRPIDRDELIGIVNKKIKNKKSSGYDEISGFLLKQVIDPIATILTHLINLSLTEGRFPNILKTNRIIPILKGGDGRYMENYRPVALISVFSKVLEYSFLSRIEIFFEKHNILSQSQYGFRRGCSTMGAVQHLYERVVGHLEEGKCPAGIFCDLSRAFDCVNVTLLITKMELYGVRGPALSWLSSYLTGRQQYVCLPSCGGGDSKSDVLSVDVGVPQGSVLGLFLFISYINDIIKKLIRIGLFHFLLMTHHLLCQPRMKKSK